ncbi:MAG: hypothetical protein R3D29_16460 [Nitratireductor sp.]
MTGLVTEEVTISGSLSSEDMVLLSVQPVALEASASAIASLRNRERALMFIGRDSVAIIGPEIVSGLRMVSLNQYTHWLWSLIVAEQR